MENSIFPRSRMYTHNLSLKHLFAAAFFLIIGARPSWAFSYDSGSNTYTCNGRQDDIQAAIDDAAANHPAPTYATAATVRMTPPGPFTVALGEDDVPLTFGTCVILTGNGRDGENATTVTLPGSWSGQHNPSNTKAVIQIGDSSAWVENFNIPDAETGVPPFSAGTPKGARITGVGYNSNAVALQSYFCFIGGGKTTPPQITIDNCDITAGIGSNELIFMRGASNAWQTADTFGSGGNVFIETNTFNGAGYVCDANANAAVTVRFNTITGMMKIDGHGLASNYPPRGVRLMEIYGNVWTLTKSFWQAIEVRGGTNRVFNNTATTTNPSRAPGFTFTDYACLEPGLSNFGNVLLTPNNYPIKDQIGEGEDVQGRQAPGGSDPAYVWNNTLSEDNSSWTWSDKTVPGNSAGGTYRVDAHEYSIGDGVTRAIKLSVQSSTLIKGQFTDAHGTWTNAVSIANDNERYVTARTTRDERELVIADPGLARRIAADAAPAVNFNAYTNWQYQTGTGGPKWMVPLGERGSFHISSEVPGTEATVILANRDFFPQTAAQHDGAYDGTQGVNSGPRASMLGTSPTTAGVGWWVTDQGSWNSTLPANTSGVLYVWTGRQWVAVYMPFQYPYYQRVVTNHPTSVIVNGAPVGLNANGQRIVPRPGTVRAAPPTK
jgi:hypothetical protein